MAAGAGLRPAGGSLRQELQKRGSLGRLLGHEPTEAARKEGAHGGTRGSPVRKQKLSELRLEL